MSFTRSLALLSLCALVCLAVAPQPAHSGHKIRKRHRAILVPPAGAFLPHAYGGVRVRTKIRRDSREDEIKVRIELPLETLDDEQEDLAKAADLRVVLSGAEPDVECRMRFKRIDGIHLLTQYRLEVKQKERLGSFRLSNRKGSCPDGGFPPPEQNPHVEIYLVMDFGGGLVFEELLLEGDLAETDF